MPTVDTPALLALDWGSSQLRARLLGPDGRECAERASPEGILALAAGDFAGALWRLCGDWLNQWNCPALASGMVGSRQGWAEAPYLECPADVHAAAQCLTAVDLGGGRCLYIAPGVRTRQGDGRHDVMRGEETQIWGADLVEGDVAVLPGTHSKWAWIGAGGALEGFASFMTGELYAVLREHSILGRLMPPSSAPAVGGGESQSAAFEAGVSLGWERPGHLMHTLFSVRTAGLMGQWPTEALGDYLSGLLIGAELGAARELRGQPPSALVLIGAPALSARYEKALERVGIPNRRAPASVTAHGQWRLAQAAGLITHPNA